MKLYQWRTPHGWLATEIYIGDVSICVAPDEDGHWHWRIGDEGADWQPIETLDDLARCIIKARGIVAILSYPGSQ